VLESTAFRQARNQAQTFVDGGEVARARTVLENAVEQGRAGLADGDAELLATMRELAALHTRLDDPTSARRLLEEAMAGAQRLAGTDPLRLMLTYDLAVVAEELANRHEARTNFARVAQFGPAALGADHWAVANARTYLDSGSLPPSAAAPPPAPPRLFPPSSEPQPSPAPQPLSKPQPSSAPQPLSKPPASPAPAPLSGTPASSAPPPFAGPQPSSAPPPSEPRLPVAPLPSFGTPAPSAPPPLFGPPPASPARPRKWWVIAAAGLAVAALVVSGVLVLRPDSSADTALLAPVTTSAAAAAPPPTAPSPATPARTVTTAASKTPPPTATTTRPAATTRATTAPPAVTTRIVSPRNGRSAPWSFRATFALSPSDRAADDTVLALSICVSGRCYLDGRVSGAPYAVRLGSSATEGAGLSWQLRVDRLSGSAFAALSAERDQEIADGSWGAKGTTLSGLNRTPVSAVTVTKKG
jgi:hypothetical protein